ncbi:MAG: serine hydrolase [Chloroflexota bacterium]
MHRIFMLLLKIVGFGLLALVLLVGGLYVYARLKPRYDRWYYQNLKLKPDVAPTQFDQALVDQLDQHFKNGDFGNTRGFIVWQKGEILYEYAQPGTTLDEKFRVWSISKSITSAAYGVGLQQSQLKPLDEPVVSAFPEYADAYQSDRRRAAMTAEDLLTMRSGYNWSELGYPSDYHRMARTDDWIAYMAAHEMAQPAGESFVYNTANTIMLAEIIARQTGQPFEEFVGDQLFGKLGIDDWQWQYGPNGVVQAGGGLSISPNDMLKLGILYLQEGEWEGEQLISQDWIEVSTSPITGDPDYFEYGYHWWTVPAKHVLSESLAISDAYFASGLGGNYIWVVPHLDLVIVTTAYNGGEMELTFPALRYFIFPALSAEAKTVSESQ